MIPDIMYPTTSALHDATNSITYGGYKAYRANLTGDASTISLNCQWWNESGATTANDNNDTYYLRIIDENMACMNYEDRLRNSYNAYRICNVEAWDWSVEEFEKCCQRNGVKFTKFIPPNPNNRMKEIIRLRQAPVIIIPESKRHITHTDNIKEIRARQTLERVLGKKSYKEFVRKGFVSVKAKSGLIYQIFPAHGITNVYQNGEMIERLCVVLRGDFPPTDSLIMRYLLILNDEQDFRKHAVKHQIVSVAHKKLSSVDNRPLAEIYKTLKVA